MSNEQGRIGIFFITVAETYNITWINRTSIALCGNIPFNDISATEIILKNIRAEMINLTESNWKEEKLCRGKGQWVEYCKE